MRIEALAAFNGGAAKIAVLAVLLSLLFLTIRFWATRARRRVERRSEDGGPGARTPGPGPGQAGAPSAALLRTNQYRQFDERFRASLQLKDRASLGSALRLRQEATELVRDVPPLYCLGKHHEMILEYNHIGLGVAARQSALESLTHEDDLRDISLALYPMFRSNSYQESLDYMTCFCASYEEALHFAASSRSSFRPR